MNSDSLREGRVRVGAVVPGFRMSVMGMVAVAVVVARTCGSMLRWAVDAAQSRAVVSGHRVIGSRRCMIIPWFGMVGVMFTVGCRIGISLSDDYRGGLEGLWFHRGSSSSIC